MNYNRIIKYCDKYNIKRYTDNDKPLTYKKLHHIYIDHINKKHKISQKQTIYNSIEKYLEDKIGDDELNDAIHHFIGNYNYYLLYYIRNGYHNITLN